MNDPWRNRNAGMRCRACVFFVEKETQSEVESCEAKSPLSAIPLTATARGHIGRCRRNAPTMKGFPVVFEADWCGEHRLDENKI